MHAPPSVDIMIEGRARKGGTAVTAWTIMLYLAGADDLEPYMARTLAALELTGPPDGVEVVVQLARASNDLLQPLMPQRQPTGIDGDWHGIRRYRLRRRPEGADENRYASELLEEVKPASLVDPAAIADFVTYSLERFPAERSMLILSGHGMGFVGMMLDLTGTRPLMMSMRGLAAALRPLKHKPDLLLLDACRMNSLEIACQLAVPHPAAGWLLTPAIQSPRHGPDYSPMLQALAAAAALPTPQAAALAAQALEPSAKATVIAQQLDPVKWRAVADAARQAGGPDPAVVIAAAAACVHPTDLQRLAFLMHQPDSSPIPVRYGYLYEQLRFARLSGLHRRTARTATRNRPPRSVGPVPVPFPLMLDWLTVLRRDMTMQQAAAILRDRGWIDEP